MEMFEQVVAFYLAVDWNEPVLMSMMTLQLLAFTIIVFLRRLRVPMLFILGAIGLSLERINSYMSQNYQSMFRVNYFDKNGNFIVTMVGFPLILNILLILVLLALESMGLLQQFRQVRSRKIKRE